MKKKKGPRKGPVLPYANFIRLVHRYSWQDKSLPELGALLRGYAGAEEDLPRLYSLLQEIIRRKTGLTLFDSQLAAARVMQNGSIAELPTGEGKTLSAVVAACCFALQKKPVHILVFNDYLARRDFTANRPIYKACGLTCGCVEEKLSPEQRKAAYACEVTYVSAKEAAFDYLRDFLCTEPDGLRFGAFSVALVDEADSILIDEARIPLVLAGNAETAVSQEERVHRAVFSLAPGGVGSNPLENQVWLTDAGIDALEETLQIENLFDAENAGLLAAVHAALEARLLVEKDRDYIVKDGAVLVVDESTGRVVKNRRFPDLLQRAVERKEGAVQNAQTVIYNSISMQSFLLQYETLCGMTGTAATSAEEFRLMYGRRVEVIPPHTPCIRSDLADAIFVTREEQQQAVLKAVRAAQEAGRPVLVGTQSVRESESYAGLLQEQGLSHSVLNARNDTEEAKIIAEAGRTRQIVISTNMAGRGVDIKLGGSGEEQADLVRKAGGLFVVSTGMNRSIRIDNQLRGRAGRQGDPGESRFFICLEDIDPALVSDVSAESPRRYPALLRRAQKIQEGRDAEARYLLERYSNILEQQRKLVTVYRREVLLGQREPGILKQREPAAYKSLVNACGLRGVTLAERQLTLYFINRNWADYLAAMEDKRSGIHLVVVGRENPLVEYRLFADSAFEEMSEDVKNDVVAWMKKCEITKDGIDMQKAGLTGATTTWTYMIDDSASQFSALPRLLNSVYGGLRRARRGLDALLDRRSK